jgi:hypothetical protein
VSRKASETIFKRVSKASPGVVVLVAAGIIVAVGLTARLAAGGFSPKKNYPQFLFEQKAARVRQKKAGAADVPADRPLFDGEVYKKSIRLQELMNLSLSPLLYVTNNLSDSARPEELANSLPRDARALLAGLKDKDMLPPGVSMSEDYKLTSETSTLILRYRPDPLDVEVISVPKYEGAGPLLLLRLSDDGEGEGIKYFESMQLKGVDVPEPFSPPSKIVSLGWMPKSVNGQLVSNADLARARESLSKAGIAR